MIEIIKEETSEDRDRRKGEGFSLPKNIRQIGEAEEDTKVYIEDYVMTYLKQLATYEADNEVVLILYGYQREITGIRYYFVSGAIRVREVNSCLYNILFNQEDWKKINEEATVFFQRLSVLGWALLKIEEADSSGHRVIGTHEEFFKSEQPIFIEYLIADKEEKVYLYQDGVMEEQKGHYIYYERNEMMQNYLVSLREEENRIEEEQTDHAAKQFRMVVQEKKEQRKRRKTNALLYATTLVLAFVIVLIGITMLNNYEKMQDMEKVLYQIANTTSTQERTLEEEAMSDEALINKENLDGQASLSEDEQAQPTISQPKSNAYDATNNADAVMTNSDGTILNSESQSISINAVSDNGIWNNKAQASDGQAYDTKSAESQAAGTPATNMQNAENQAAGTQETSTKTTDDQTAGTQTTGWQAVGSQTLNQQTSDAQTTKTQTTDGQAAGTQAANTQIADDQVANTQASNMQTSNEQAAQQTAAFVYQTYEIKWGDTLEKINQKFYGSVNRIEEICALNNIKNKDNICYGEKILLPQ